jgi:hypothetical protein
MFFALKNPITERISQSAGLVIDLVLYKHRDTGHSLSMQTLAMLQNA